MRGWLKVVAGTLSFALSLSGQSAAEPVTPATFTASLSSAQGGDRIELAGGDYGALNLSGVTFPSDVTIISADPANPAIIRDLYVNNSSHIVFDGIQFDYSYNGEALSFRPFEVLNSSYITIRNSVFDGAAAIQNQYGTGFGLVVSDSDHVTLDHNEFFDWYKAVSFGLSSDIVVSNNDVHTINSDGFNFVSVDGVLIEGNYIHDFKRDLSSGGHADMIQFWTVLGQTSSQNVTIRDNFFDGGDGSQTQTIFMRNGVVDQGKGSFSEYAYRIIVIEDNVIYNGQVHGITVGETDGLVVRNNTLLFDPYLADGVLNPPQIRLSGGSINVTVVRNIVHKNVRARPGWTVGQNFLVQSDRRDQKNHYSRLFTKALTPEPGLAGLRALRGGVIEVGGFGAAMTRSDITLDAGPAMISLQ